MNSLEEMLENVNWLAKADFFSPTVRFGAVSRGFSRKYLKQLRDEESLFYFERCIPTVDYGVSTAIIGFDICAEDGLFVYTEEVATCEPLIPMALIPVAFDPGGEPLLLDVESGQLWYFLTGYIEGGQSISFYSAQDSGFVEIPLTKENVLKMAKARFEGFSSFFRHAREATTNEETLAIWRCIEDEDVEYLDHLMSLDLDLNVVNKEGRGPAEEAERQGKDKLARMIRRYLDARCK